MTMEKVMMESNEIMGIKLEVMLSKPERKTVIHNDDTVTAHD